MDEADLGNMSAEFFRQDILQKIRRDLCCGPAAETCEDCGEEIPEKRRQAVPGCTRCVACQLQAEGWGK